MRESGFFLALDLGTTTLVGRLLTVAGEVAAESRLPNPQIGVAADIIRRLEAARSGQAQELQQLLVQGIHALTDELFRQAGMTADRLQTAAIAGNPGITHLLAGEPVERLLFPPHRPSFRGGQFYPAERFGLAFAGLVYLFPLVSGYVGGDLVAFLFGSPESREPTLYVDIGTNAELALFAGDLRLVSSVAAGPAFEAGEIACGMPRRDGAVEEVRVVADRLQLKVVGEGAPLGLCGSGLVTAVAAGLEGGLIDAAGTLLAPAQVATNLARYLDVKEGGAVLRLYRDARIELLLTQDDLRAFQLAKGALRAGIECLLERAALSFADVNAVVVTGAFGTALPPAILKKVAILPDSVIEKVRFEADGVLRGACRFLCSTGAESLVEHMAETLRPYPLSGTPAFEKAFIAALNF